MRVSGFGDFQLSLMPTHSDAVNGGSYDTFAFFDVIRHYWPGD
jgi:hypothetical protein